MNRLHSFIIIDFGLPKGKDQEADRKKSKRLGKKIIVQWPHSIRGYIHSKFTKLLHRHSCLFLFREGKWLMSWLPKQKWKIDTKR